MSIALHTRSVTLSQKRRRWKRPAHACGTSTSAIRSRSASARRRTSSRPSSGRCATATIHMDRPQGFPPAREAVAAEYTANGFPVSPDRVFITAGTSEGIELTLSAIVESGGEVLVPMPTYPLYTAVLAKLDAQREVLPPGFDARVDAGSGSSEEPRDAGDARARRDRPEQPDRRRVPHRDADARCSISRTSTGCRFSRTRSMAISDSTARSPRTACSIPTRPSSPSRACRRRIWRRDGAPAGWRSAARRALTM